jgi:hypothetical protein
VAAALQRSGAGRCAIAVVEAVMDAVEGAGALHVSGDAPSAAATAEDVAPSAVDSAREDSVAVAAMVAGEGEEGGWPAGGAQK